MRKIKADRNKKKFKNSLNDFYLSYLNSPIINNKLREEKSNKKVEIITENSKLMVERMYLDLRVEDRYMYNSNFYQIYKMLCIYSDEINKIEYKIETTCEDEKIKKKYKELRELETTKNLIGYETAFSLKIQNKFSDTLHWFHSCIVQMIKFYIFRLKDNRQKPLTDELTNKIIHSDIIYKRKEEGIQKEIDYINEILARIDYARKNIDVIFSFDSDKDKKLRTMIKSSLTRAENLINIIIDEIEAAYNKDLAA